MEKFTIGLLTGMVGGALLVANNRKMQALVKKGQTEIEKTIDEKLDAVTAEKQTPAEPKSKKNEKTKKKA